MHAAETARMPVWLSGGFGVLGIVVAWKVALLVSLGLPVPSNDAFFYDGAVVSVLQGGAYVNSTVVDAFPISGGQVFSASPPLYQGLLWCWLRVVGVGIVQIQWLHVLLFAVFAAGAGTLFHLWRVSTSAAVLGGLFLFGITFNDRPDSLAHALGVWSLVAWSLGARVAGRSGPWAWVAALAVVLTLATSVQIGGLYLAINYALGAWAICRGEEGAGWLAWLAMLLVPVVVVLCVMEGKPLWWDGFREHVRLTPSHTGWRWPTAFELIKAVRTGPAVLVMAGWWLRENRLCRRWIMEARPVDRLGGVLALACVTVLGAAMVVFAANFVAIAGYLQVLVVGLCFDGLAASERGHRSRRRWLTVALGGLVVLTSVRAIGLSTVGVVAARALGPVQAQALVRDAYDRAPESAVVVVSSVFLYELSGRSGARLVHSDWALALETQRPGLLVLTAFDYHRGFAATVERLVREGRVRATITSQDGGVRPPDTSAFWGRVWSHLTWQPVIVELDWVNRL